MPTLDDVKANEVQAKIDAGDEACKAVQAEITRKHNGAANRERQSVRSEWAAERKNLMALWVVVDSRDAKKAQEGEPDA